MKKNAYAELSNETLIKKRDLMKGIAIGFGILYLLIIAVVVYLLATHGFQKLSIATLIPIFILPVTLMPLLMNWGLLNNEIKSRNLK